MSYECYRMPRPELSAICQNTSWVWYPDSDGLSGFWIQVHDMNSTEPQEFLGINILHIDG